ncbi:MAG: hypothetical protein LLG06_04120 [Desulfobacteraceae bacterium]|nr:hypothetical protein [Desulfobacteraceae bacterium]
MKRIATICFALAILFSFTAPAFAADTIMDAKISKLTVAKDKNGNEYVRMIVETPKVINGVHYNASMAIMAFSPHVEMAKKLKAGDNFKAVVNIREHQGRESASIISFVK